ncbi:helix-turn-helix transcriptional regulator [Thalassiella azotivora]
MTIQEVAEATRLPLTTLRWMRYRGEGPRMFRLGRRVVAKAEDVEAWIEEQRAADDTWRPDVA